MKPIIDVHAHFLPEGAIRASETGEVWHGLRIEVAADSAQAVSRPSAGPGSKAEKVFRRIARYFVRPEERLELMRKAGVDMQVVSLTPSLFRYDLDVGDAVSFCRDVNDDLHQWQRRWPDRYRGLGTLPLQNTDASIAELERCVGELGLLGFIADTHVNGEDWDSPRLFAVLEAAEKLDALVFLHPGSQRVASLLPRYHLRNFIGNPFETTVAIASLIFGGVLDRLPDAKMLFAHAGGFACANAGRFDHGHRVRPETKDTSARLPSDYLRRLYYDPITFSESGLRALVDIAGAGQVVLGTDFPADMGMGNPYEWIMSREVLSDPEKEAILRDNPARLINLS
jgi:aminocarboxymuconate-semialdehyde decarboxylase